VVLDGSVSPVWPGTTRLTEALNHEYRHVMSIANIIAKSIVHPLCEEHGAPKSEQDCLSKAILLEKKYDSLLQEVIQSTIRGGNHGGDPWAPKAGENVPPLDDHELKIWNESVAINECATQ
jgi:hypothetical protein